MTPALVLAHGIGGRSDLPLPLWMFSYGAGAVLLISFVALRILWPRPRLDAAAGGRLTPAWTSTATAVVGVTGRVVGVAAFALVLAVAVFGTDNAASNLAPVAIFVLFWVGLQVASAVVGDVWAVLSPWDTLAGAAARLRQRRSSPVAEEAGVSDRAGVSDGAGVAEGRAPARRTVPPPAPSEQDTHWPAVVGISAFVWLELCYHDPASPRVLALALAGYAVAMLAGAARWGRGWLRTGDGFAVWFGLLAAMAPLTRDDEGRLRLRWPFVGLAGIEPRAGTTWVVMVVLGSTAFDGLTRTSLWADVLGTRSGWASTIVATVGLAWVVGIVALAYTGAMRLAARLTAREPGSLVTPFLHSLVPIALAYAVAHYFSLFVFRGSTGRGLDLRPLRPGVGPVRHGRPGHRLPGPVDHDRGLRPGRRHRRGPRGRGGGGP